MCRCCQNCWEDFYWNCFEEKFCYDESIANYNADEDDQYIATVKNGSVLGRLHSTAENNNLTVPVPVCNQPLRQGNSASLSSKIHEEDYRRETQTNVPMLGPEILAVFANSQIFQDHQPTKLNRISTKANLASVHSSHKSSMTDLKETEQDRLIRRLEGDSKKDDTDSNTQDIKLESERSDGCEESSPEKRITFTVTPDSSPEGSEHFTPSKFDAIAEEGNNLEGIPAGVVLRPRLIDRNPNLMHVHASGGNGPVHKKVLRTAKSVPHFNVRPVASETDIFSISGSVGQISMTPEVPSISYSNLPKNYEDTPTIDKYRVSQSLYSIQTANAARVSQDDFSMPRYFRRPMLSQSSDMLAGSSMASVESSLKDENIIKRPEKEKSKRLQMLRGNLPPLLIHSVSFRKNRDEAKQVD